MPFGAEQASEVSGCASARGAKVAASPARLEGPPFIGLGSGRRAWVRQPVDSARPGRPLSTAVTNAAGASCSLRGRLYPSRRRYSPSTAFSGVLSRSGGATGTARLWPVRIDHSILKARRKKKNAVHVFRATPRAPDSGSEISGKGRAQRGSVAPRRHVCRNRKGSERGKGRRNGDCGTP